MDTAGLVWCMLVGFCPAGWGKIRKVDVKTWRLYSCGEWERRVQVSGEKRATKLRPRAWKFSTTLCTGVGDGPWVHRPEVLCVAGAGCWL